MKRSGEPFPIYNEVPLGTVGSRSTLETIVREMFFRWHRENNQEPNAAGQYVMHLVISPSTWRVKISFHRVNTAIPYPLFPNLQPVPPEWVRAWIAETVLKSAANTRGT